MRVRSDAARRAPRRVPARPPGPPPLSRSPPKPLVSRQRDPGGVEHVELPPIYFHTHPRPNAHIRKARQSGDERLAAGVQVDERLTAERLDDEHVRVTRSLIDGAQSDEFGPNAHLQLTVIGRQL